MKKLLIIISVFFASFTLFADTPDTLKTETNQFATLKRPYIMNITLGKLIHAGGRTDARYLGRRKSVNTEITLRFTGFFSKYVGAYGSISVCGDPWKDVWNPVEGYVHQQRSDVGEPPSTMVLHVGGAFRYEIRRCQFYARLGAGIRGMGGINVYYYMSDPDGHPDYESIFIRANRSTVPFIVAGGLTVGYRLSRVVSFVLDVDYRHQIGNACTAVIETVLPGEDGSETILERSVYGTKSFGKELSVRLGFQLQCELSGQRKKKKTDTKKAP